MVFMAGGGLGGEAGAEIPGIAPGDATTGSGRWNSRSGAMSGKGAHKQTHPGRRGDKGHADATSVPQGFLNFHRPDKTHAHEARLGIPKDSPLSH